MGRNMRKKGWKENKKVKKDVKYGEIKREENGGKRKEKREEKSKEKREKTRHTYR